MSVEQETAGLAACPLCRGEAEIIRHRYAGTGASGMETPEPSIRCKKCRLETRQYRADDWPSGRKAGTPTYKQAEAELIKDWNTRTSPTIEAVEDEREVEAAARALAELDIRTKRRWDTEPADIERILPEAVDYCWPEYVEQVNAVFRSRSRPTTKDRPGAVEEGSNVAG